MNNKLHSVPRKLMIAGLFVVGSTALITYYPSLKMDFRFWDDYTYLHLAGSMPLPEYLAHVLDPRLQDINYRPLRRILVLLEYGLFHSQASYYHLVQVVIHLANALLILAIVWRLAKRWRVAFAAAILYAGVGVTNDAVFWITDETPLAAFFSLAAVLFWVNHLQTKDKSSYLLAIGALTLALLSKESAAVIPIVFFLIDRMLIRDRIAVFDLGHRYVLIAGILMAYLAIEYAIQRRGVFMTVGGYSVGEHVLFNYTSYLAMLAFPWRYPRPLNDFVILLLWSSFAGLAIVKQSAGLMFLALLVLLAISPFVFFIQGAYARFLYLAGIPLAVLWALAFETPAVYWRFGWFRFLTLIPLAGLVILNGSNAADTAADMSEFSRQNRVPFRDIMLQHPAFPDGTRLFFIEPPYNLMIPDIAGFFFLRYGAGVSINGTHADGRPYAVGKLGTEKANLRDYAQSFVYYFDETNRPIEISVEKRTTAQALPKLPLDFARSIRLEGYEITSSTLRKGQPLVLFLYWRALGKIERDYTVFVHLVNASGEILVGEDSLPRNGQERTSEWKLNQFTADAHRLVIPQDLVAGEKYYLEVGLYYLPTMERLATADNRGDPFSDRVVIEPFDVVE